MNINPCVCVCVHTYAASPITNQGPDTWRCEHSVAPAAPGAWTHQHGWPLPLVLSVQGSTLAGGWLRSRRRRHSTVKGNVRGQSPCSEGIDVSSQSMCCPDPLGTCPQLAGEEPTSWGKPSSDTPQERQAERWVSDYVDLSYYLCQL